MPSPRLIDWILRLAVALQCAGYAWQLGIVHESPLLGWLWEPRDVGGLALGEPAALAIVKVVAVLLAVAAVSALLWPLRLVLVGVAVFQFTFAWATWQTYSGFPLDVAWLGTGTLRAVADRLVPLFPFAAGAARMAAPLVLLLVHWSSARRLLGVAITPAAEWLMRTALALTFFAHGLEALQQRGQFLDMLILATQYLLDARLPEAAAQRVLLGIGAIDLLVALLVLCVRWRWVAWYMAFWGLVTATARLVVWGVELGGYEMAVRSAHWALPVVLALAWRLAPNGTGAVKQNLAKTDKPTETF